jgi:hypothetical protein
MAALVVAGRSPADVTVAQRSSSPSTGRYEPAAGGLVTMPRTEQADQARAWLRSTGFDVVVEDRDRRDELMRTGFAGVASENHTHWAHLVSLRDPDFVVRNCGSGRSADDAVIRARRRYGSEQA